MLIARPIIDGGTCQVEVNMSTEQTTLSSWYEIWEAVTAVATMCVRAKSKGGRARGLGMMWTSRWVRFDS